MTTNQIQELIAGMRRQREESQLTLGKLIKRLEVLPAETPIYLTGPHSYRGYYEDLAFDRPDHPSTAAEVIDLCRSMIGAVLEGYKGGDFEMGENTPVWLAAYGCRGQAALAILDDGTIQLGGRGLASVGTL